MSESNEQLTDRRLHEIRQDDARYISVNGVTLDRRQLLYELDRLRKQFGEYRNAVPLCDKHAPTGGARSGCMLCGLAKQSAILSRISYLVGEKNEMEVSAYDVNPDEEQVLKDVEKRLVEPIDMLLFCPVCKTQHVDSPDGHKFENGNCVYCSAHHSSTIGADACKSAPWTNPPHRSHQCRNVACGHVWRPSDRATNGVKEIRTKGTRDGSPYPWPEFIVLLP